MPPPAETHTLVEILRSLNRARVKYLVVGGVAVLLHGVDRTTRDLDLMPSLDSANLLKAVRALGRLGYRPLLPVSPESIADASVRTRWIRDKNLKVFSMIDPRDPLHPVDLMIIERIPFARAWPRRVRIRVEGVAVPLMSVPDLVKMKKKAGRDRDRSDIESLKRLNRGKK